MAESHQILFPKTAHYFTHGTPGKHVKYFWIACHGYGQLANFLIKKFEDFDTSDSFVLAPEGLSRFYWNNATGQVGASWMTKKDRLDEIADYTRYLKLLYDEYVQQFDENVVIILLGFSQGCATQVRWVMREFPPFHHLVLWGGLIPEDLDYTPHTDFFSKIKKYWVYGDEDQYLNEERIQWHHQFFKEQFLEFETIVFEGKHKIEIPALKNLEQKIRAQKSD